MRRPERPELPRRVPIDQRRRRLAPLVAAGAAMLVLSCGGGGAGSGTSGGETEVPGTRPERLSLLLADLAERVVVPRYATMSRTFAALDDDAAAFCAAPDAAGLESLRASWRASIEAWIEASIIQFGPIRDDNRRLRIQFWPDANNNVARAVQQMLARTDELNAETLSGQSVAAQGLPALEELLFDPDLDVLASFTTGERAARRCTFTVAITGNLRSIAAAIEGEWRRTGGGWVDQLARAGRGSDAFATREAAIEEVVNSLVTVVEVTKNNRIGDPLGGETVADAKPFRAESFLSANSFANVISAVRGLEAAYTGDGRFGFDDYLKELDRVTLDTEIETEFRAVLERADAIPVSLADAVGDEAYRAQVVDLFDRATLLTRLIKNQLSAAMQVTVGFNENDGD